MSGSESGGFFSSRFSGLSSFSLSLSPAEFFALGVPPARALVCQSKEADLSIVLNSSAFPANHSSVLLISSIITPAPSPQSESLKSFTSPGSELFRPMVASQISTDNFQKYFPRFHKASSRREKFYYLRSHLLGKNSSTPRYQLRK